MAFLVIKIASIYPHPTYSQMLLPTLHTHGTVVTTISLVVLLLRVVSLLTLIVNIFLPFVTLELLGILIRIRCRGTQIMPDLSLSQTQIEEGRVCLRGGGNPDRT